MHSLVSHPGTRAVAILIGIVLIVGGAAALLSIKSISLPRLTNDNTSFPSLLPAIPLPTTLSGEESGRINVLVVGISGEGYISGELTDSIIFASLAPSQNRAHLVGIPRDLWVQGPDGTFTKINELYALAGGTDQPNAQHTHLLAAKVKELTGQEIHYSVVIDLDATNAVVDAVGGLTLNGEFYDAQAINQYVRDRSTPGGDFDRMRRQQQVIVGVVETLRQSDPQTLLELYEVLFSHVSTSASVFELMRFFEVGNAIPTEAVTLHTITPQTQGLLVSGYRDVAGRSIYTLTPTAGLSDYRAITQYVTDTLTQP